MEATGHAEDLAAIAGIRRNGWFKICGAVEIGLLGQFLDECRALPASKTSRSAQFMHELHRETIFRLFTQPRLLSIASKLIGGEILLHPNFFARLRVGQGADYESAWHQDIGSPPKRRSMTHMINVWLPLVPVGRGNGCPQFIPGTHKRGPVAHGLYFGRIADKILSPVEHRSISVSARPGDAILFSNLTFHRVLPNRTPKARWSFDFRYQSADQSTLVPEAGYLLASSKSPGAAIRTHSRFKTTVPFQ